MTEVYIGKVKSIRFDFNKQGDPDGYFPKAMCEPQFHSDLYFAILDEPNTKQTDSSSLK